MRADFALDYDMLTVEREQKLYLMARFVAGSADKQGARRPLNLSLVLDRSGSMAGAKLDYTRQAVQFLVQHLSGNDICSIVLYNDKVETLFAPQRITNKDALIQQIDTIRPRGTTNLSGGWLEGCQHVRHSFDRGFLNRVIVLSDGLANRGITDQAQLISLARQKYEEGISTTTMGLGSDFNEDLMMEMANAGGGAFYFIESPEVAPEIFREELSGLLSLVAQNLMITLAPTAEVKGVRQLNAYPMQSNGYGTTFRMGDMFAEETKTLLLEINIPSLHDLGEKQIAMLSFEYDELTATGVVHRTQDVAVTVNVRSADALPTPPDVHVTQAVLLLSAAQARQEAVKYADRGDFNGASQVLRTAALMIDQSIVQNDQLKEEQRALIMQADELAGGDGGSYNEYSRKTMSTQAYYTMQDRHEQTMMLRLREVERARGNAIEPASSSAPTVNPSGQKGATDYLVDKFQTVDKLQTVEKPVTGSYEKRDVRMTDGLAPTVVEWRGQTFSLDADIIRIGRAIHNEIVIEERGVSRFHSQIRRENDQLWIEDMGSTNGTLLGGERLTQAHRLSVGDMVYVCDEKLTFR